MCVVQRLVTSGFVAFLSLPLPNGAIPKPAPHIPPKPAKNQSFQALNFELDFLTLFCYHSNTMSSVYRPLCPAPHPGHSARLMMTIHDFIMALPGLKSGKFAGIVYQRARYGQIFYPAFIPYNPKTPAQQAVRGTFARVSARWRTLNEDQRVLWCAVAQTKMSKPRLGQCGPLTGFLLFVKVNVRLAHQGKPQVDLPPESPRPPQPTVSSRFDQPPLGPTLFLQAHQLMAGRDDAPRPCATGQAL